MSLCLSHQPLQTDVKYVVNLPTVAQLNGFHYNSLRLRRVFVHTLDRSRYENILLTKTTNQYSCGQRLTGRHTSSAGNLFGIPPVLPVCRPWFAQVRDKSFHTHKPVCPELVVFDMLHARTGGIPNKLPAEEVCLPVSL